MEKMNPEVKQKWLDALRSGEYKHGKSRLVTVEKDTKTYCCLGVLCDIYVKEVGGIEWDTKRGMQCLADGDNTQYHYLPQAVKLWAGLNANNPIIRTGKTGLDDFSTIAVINDLPTTQDYSPLITIIEEQL